MTDVGALYLILLAAVAGYVLIARVPAILHTPMMSGSNFIHGIVLAGAMLALGNANGILEQIIGFLAVMAAAANVVGGFVVTDRMLALFDIKGSSGKIEIEPEPNDSGRIPAAPKSVSGDKADAISDMDQGNRS
jgi:NAD(P) transhydrogenase subunit alpha